MLTKLSVIWAKLGTRANRKKLYALAATIIPLLALLGVIGADSAPTWITALGVILGTAAPATALANLTPEEAK